MYVDPCTCIYYLDVYSIAVEQNNSSDGQEIIAQCRFMEKVLET